MNSSITAHTSKTVNAANVTVGSKSRSTARGNFTLDVQSPVTFMYFKINGSTVASLTRRNTIVNYDKNPYGLDLQKNDLYNVKCCNKQ